MKVPGPAALPVELFRTAGHYYVFDAVRVIFLEVDAVVFKIISILKQKPENIRGLAGELPEHSDREIVEALKEINEIQKQGFLKPDDFSRAAPYSRPHLKANLNGNLNALYLNIISRCNLACSYCIYGGNYDNHHTLQQGEMDWRTARKAIDFFLSRARREGRLRLDFFGGEPLLAFPLMKRIVKIIKTKIARRKQELMVSISSNGTVLNDEILDFLIANDIHLQVSLDGEREIHNAVRKFKVTKIGSFDRILRNLRLIFERDPDYYVGRVSIKAVLTGESLQSDDIEFLEMPLIDALNSRRRFSMINRAPHHDLKKDRDFFSRLRHLGSSLLAKRHAKTLDELLAGLNYRLKYLFYMTFYDFFQIQIVNSLYFDSNNPVPFSKDCMVGMDGYVNVDGSISICYKADFFVIGNVIEDTWYFDKIEELQKIRHGHPRCKDCFVRRFCKLCYEKLNGKAEQLEDSIRGFCEFNRCYYRVIFGYMLRVLEKNPALWSEMQRQAKEESKRLRKV